VHGAVLPLGLDGEAGVAEDAEHAAVVGERLGREAPDPVPPRHGRQVLEEEGGNAAALVGIVDDEGDLGLVGPRRSVVADHGEDLVVLGGHEGGPVGAVDLNAAIDTCLEAASRQTLVVVVSDLLTPAGVAGGLEALQARLADVVVVHVVSPDELEPRLSGEVELIDAETNGVLELGVSLETLAAYRSRFAAWLEERAAECRTRGIRYARVRTDRPLNMVVLDDLRQAGMLR